MEGIDTKAIKIEDIAKTQEENALLEEEFLNDLRSSLDEDELNEVNEENLDLKEIYNKFVIILILIKKATLSIQKKSTKMLLII